MKRKISVAIVILIAFTAFFGPSTASAQKSKRKGEFYFSWGYNTEWYTHSNLHIEQAELGNDYTFKKIRGYDHRGWDETFFTKPLTIPQYNYRIGYFFNKKKNLAFEINFDHTKFIFANQRAHLVGTLDGKYTDTTVTFNEANGFYYFLNNGANFLLFNIVKRWEVYHSPNEKIKIDFLGKGGIGPVIPHVENSFFGKKNTPNFQLGGWNVGFEGAMRATFFNTVYLEFCNKVDYARYSHLKIYKGLAHQAFGTYELIANLGFTFPAGKKVK
jgi:hypothetical protein